MTMFLVATRQIETHRSKRLRVKGLGSRGSDHDNPTFD
jgi:hypothetical protein